MEKFLKEIHEIKKKIQTLDHMIYITFPLIKDKQILLKILTETKSTIADCINSVLQYEYLYKRIDLSTNPKTNFRIFQVKCAPKYNITKGELKEILDLFELVEKHKQSAMEFLKNDKVVILSDTLNQETLTIEKIKKFFFLAKSIAEKTFAGIN